MGTFQIYAFAAAFAGAVLLTGLLRRAGLRYGWVAHPRRDRWHRTPTALSGGVAIYLASLPALALILPWSRSVLILLGCATAFFLLGLWDDVRHVRPATKLAVHVICSAAFIALGGTLHFTGSPLIDFLVTLFWLVGITNAMNLLDNMDGLCAGIAAIAAAFRVVFCAIEGDATGLTIALIFLAAVLGYLVYNFPPASVFMGDSGSLYIGFMLAAMLVGPHPYSKNIFAVLLFPVMVMIIPIFDTTLVTLGRKLSGRAISVGGRDHASHRLVAAGLSERGALLILYTIALVSGGLAYLLYQDSFSYPLFFLGLFVMGLVLFGVFLSRLKIDDGVERDSEMSPFLLLIVEAPYLRHLLFLLFDVLLIMTAYLGAHWLRFENIRVGDGNFAKLIESLPILLAISVGALLTSGLYDRTWRYTSVRDLAPMLRATVASAVLTVLSLTFIYRFEGYSRSVFVIHGMLQLGLLAGSRLAFRLLHESLTDRSEGKKRVLVYGAGDAGELLLRQARNNQAWGLEVVGFLDDDSRRINKQIHGVPILGGVQTAEFWIRKHAVDQIIVSSHKIPESKIEQLQFLSEGLDVELVRASVQFQRIAL